MATISFSVETRAGDELVHELPAVYVVCEACSGHGEVLAPGLRGHAYSSEAFAEAFDDDDDRAEYFRPGGRYDVPCDVCAGKRVVLVVDEDEAGRTLRGRRLLAIFEHVSEREAAYRRCEAAERRMGA